MITRSLSGFYTVTPEPPAEAVVCKARGRFRREGTVPLVGDRVVLSVQPDGTGRLEELLPRTSEFVRPPVANIDTMVIVGSLAIPRSDTFLLDRVTAVCAHKGIRAILCFNKQDLAPTDELTALYRSAGYPVIATSAETGEGLEDLRALLRGHISAFTGNSGVGKSSLLQKLDPSLHLKVGEVSEKLGRGRHTTRHVELLPLSGNIWVADTPGFSAFEPGQMELLARADLEKAFPEFARYRGDCRYRDCLHVGGETSGCAVLDALTRGEIVPSRYDSYRKLFEQTRPLYS